MSERILRGKLARCALVALAACLALAFTGGLAGCSGGQSQTAASTTQAVSEQPDYVGAWDVIELTNDGETYGEKELQAARAKGIDYFMNIEADGLWLLCLGNSDNLIGGTWAESSDGNLTLTADNGAVSAFAIDGDTAKVGTMAFRKSGEARTPPAPAESSSTAASSNSSTAGPSTATADSGEVSPDLKEMLDSYEAVMDEYVDFMQKYQDSGYSASMLSDYTTMMQKYLDFTQKIDALDTSNMSKADYAYYIEVTGRVSQKLLSVL